MEIISLVKHPVDIYDGDRVTVTIPPSGQEARVQTTDVPVASLEENGVAIPTVRRRLGEVTGLPEPREGVTLLVSSMVLAAAPGRSDLVVPHIPVRDADGDVIGCRALAGAPT